MIDTKRIVGLDIARFIAIVGMVIVHASTDLVVLPIERLHPDMSITPPETPLWAYYLQIIFTERARPLFIFLAGIGISVLMSRKGRKAKVLVIRAVYLLSLGIILVIIGWSDIILCIYGFMFFLAAGIYRLRSGTLIFISLLLFVLPFPFTIESGFYGTSYILSQVSFFLIGLVVGRQSLRNMKTKNQLLMAGAILETIGLVGLYLKQGSLLGVEKGSPTLIALSGISAFGFCFLILSLCLKVKGTSLLSKLIAVTGGMPLTVYSLHAVLFTILSHTLKLNLGHATFISFGYIIFALIGTNLWARLGHKGPLETLMRRVSEPFMK
ncbi:DUF418 domain-containing protein [Metabacillus sp. JX24]|uniref:DUF418 domain-containing protein n=1 Tax=Metabacillus sp. JX24 TaxID=3240759 RepID=UPI00350F1150